MFSAPRPQRITDRLNFNIFIVCRSLSQAAEAAAVLQNQNDLRISSMSRCLTADDAHPRVINGNSVQSAVANNDLALATPKIKKLTAREWENKKR